MPIYFVRSDTQRVGPNPTWPPTMTRPATTWGGEDGRRAPPPSSSRAAVASGRQRRVWAWPLFLRNAPIPFAARRSRSARAAPGPVLRGSGGESAAAAPRGAHPVRSRRLGVPQSRILRKACWSVPIADAKEECHSETHSELLVIVVFSYCFKPVHHCTSGLGNRTSVETPIQLGVVGCHPTV